MRFLVLLMALGSLMKLRFQKINSRRKSGLEKLGVSNALFVDTEIDADFGFAARTFLMDLLPVMGATFNDIQQRQNWF